MPWRGPPPAEYSCCPMIHCLCSWRSKCSPAVPRVAPSKGYACIGANADNDPAFSVLVGVMAGAEVTSLGLHRFCVGLSGRILGFCGDALEVVADDLDYKAKTTNSSSVRAAAATRSSDGRSLSLCLFSLECDLSSSDDEEEFEFKTPRPLQLNLDLVAADDRRIIGVSSLPDLPIRPGMPTCPVSVAGELWAPYLTGVDSPFDLVMQRLDKDTCSWIEVARLSLPKGIERDCYRRNTPIIQGFAVVDRTILLSLYPSHLFFTFNCSTLVWKSVKTQQMSINPKYIPINGRGVYVKEHDAIYFLHGRSLYSYNLCLDQQHSMMPPTLLARLSPFCQGNGFVAHLDGQLMCSVWIGDEFGCDCDTEHVLITTFRVKGCYSNNKHFVPKGIHVLQSTCRRLKRSPSKHSEPHCEFCFLQEYKEFSHENATPPAKRQRWYAISSNVGSPSCMIPCCREFFNGTPFSYAVDLQFSSIQIDVDLYIVSQATACSTVYRINVLNGRLMCLDTILKPHCTLATCSFSDEEALINRTGPLPWHFVCDTRYIYAAGHMDNELYSCSLHEGQLHHSTSVRPIGVEFQLVLGVGIKILALTDNLQCVYHLSRTNEWIRRETSVPLPYLGRKVNLSGYVVLNSECVMVSDADSDCCFLLNLQQYVWNIVKPCDQTGPWTHILPGRAFLSGRSLFFDGFIYTCETGGLAVYELVEDGDSYYIRDRIYLKFSWENYWQCHHMCFEYVGKDTNSGSIMFCVVQDYSTSVHMSPDNTLPVSITTVEVKTEEMSNGNLKPKTIGHVDIGTVFVGYSGSEIWTRNCFAVAPF